MKGILKVPRNAGRKVAASQADSLQQGRMTALCCSRATAGQANAKHFRHNFASWWLVGTAVVGDVRSVNIAVALLWIACYVSNMSVR